MNYSKVAKKLRSMGLPNNLFDEDFEQQHALALQRYEILKERLARLAEEDPEWWGALVGVEIDHTCLVQGRSPAWLKARRELLEMIGTMAHPNYKLHQRAWDKRYWEKKKRETALRRLGIEKDE